MRYLAVVLIAVVLCQGCGSSAGGEDGMRTLTEQQALERIEDYVHRAVAVLPTGARLEALSSPESHACDDPTDNGPKGRVFASNLYWVRGIEQQDTAKYLEGLRRWWSEQGFSVVTDAWDKAQSITMENKENGFRMSFRKGDTDPAIGASSPCVWPKGTPEPS
jgi:hypothetical protein